jgi:hypothetical protein
MPTIAMNVGVSKHLCKAKLRGASSWPRRCALLMGQDKSCWCHAGFATDTGTGMLNTDDDFRVYRPQACKDASV